MSDSTSALGALGLVLVLVGGFALLPRVLGRREPAMVGRDAPDFTLPLVANGQGVGDGGQVRLSGLRGHAVLLDFWATWCEPCRIEAPIVDAVSRRWRDQGVVVVGVDTDGPDQGDPRAFARARGLTYPIARDTSGAAQRAFDVEVLPTLVVISSQGKIMALRTGITGSDELEQLVRKAL
jgi:cytochrome c biogenesis protein CcmG/thiol:disulfide interchange protein DsbE